jgi:RNA polymerase sigma-70 factor, ECF subfamily
MNRQTSNQPVDFEHLVRDHGGRIRRIAQRFAAHGAIDDLVQDILTRVWRSLPGFKGEADIQSWIYRIALNAAMTHLAAEVKARDLRVALAEKTVATEGAPPGASPAVILRDFLGRLGDVDCSILMMYMDGLTAEDMSGVLGISSNAINVRINRIKSQFSDIYVE